MITEATRRALKKKEEDDEKQKLTDRSDGHLDPDCAHDFSVPLGDNNLYKRQGQSNIGPFTAEGTLKALVDAIVEGVVNEKKL